jgi:hypothetical protein
MTMQLCSALLAASYKLITYVLQAVLSVLTMFDHRLTAVCVDHV